MAFRRIINYFKHDVPNKMRKEGCIPLPLQISYAVLMLSIIFVICFFCIRSKMYWLRPVISFVGAYSITELTNAIVEKKLRMMQKNPETIETVKLKESDKIIPQVNQLKLGEFRKMDFFPNGIEIYFNKSRDARKLHRLSSNIFKHSIN
ncbi:MAG: hypothetical protein ACTSO3_06140, partial [Candidatus Heimdallarchaeaceae archaeon]